jgi:hypothetical protein
MARKWNLQEHPSYAKIMGLYNDELRKAGRVSALKFFRDIVRPEIPDLPERTWSYFVQKHITDVGLPIAPVPIAATPEMQAIQVTLVDNETATRQGLQAALNIGMSALGQLLNDPVALAKLSPEKRADLMFKAMKAQDSRVHAIGRMKDDKRAEEKFNRTFSGAAYGKKT